MATHMSLQVQDKTTPKLATSFTPARSGLLQRKCACGETPGIDGECAECRSKRLSLQRSPANQSAPSTVPPIVHDVLRSPGQPLDAATRAFMEPRFGHDFSKLRVHTTKPKRNQAELEVGQPGDIYEQEAEKVAERVLSVIPDTNNSVQAFSKSHFGYDFSQVRVHADAKAAESARAVNALAYTIGRHVVFGAGQYTPSTATGRRLLTHELTHVVQQTVPILSRTDLGEYVSFSAESYMMRKSYPGCSSKVTNLNPDEVEGHIEQAQSEAVGHVSRVLDNLGKLSSRTITLLDRHFHCPSHSDLKHIVGSFQKIKAKIPTFMVSCMNKCNLDPKSKFMKVGDVSSDGEVKLCPLFFELGYKSKEVLERALIFIEAAAIRIGKQRLYHIEDPSYDDFVKFTSEKMLENMYSYVYFVAENSGIWRHRRQLGIVPCRPLNTGMNVIVPPDAAKNPHSIRFLTGFEAKPTGSKILPVFVDQSGKYFIYQSGLPGGRVYMPGEGERYYFPGGQVPPVFPK